MLVSCIFTVAVYYGVYTAVCDTGLRFCVGSLRSPKLPSPSSPAFTTGTIETDTQSRHGASQAAVQGHAVWAALPDGPPLAIDSTVICGFFVLPEIP